MRKFVVGDFHAGLRAFLFGEQSVEKLIGEYLILPMLLRHLREVRQRAAIQFHGFLHQFPADTGDHLFAPGIEESGKGNTAGGRRAAELAVAFDDHCLRSGASGLNGRDVSRRASANHEDVDIVRDLHFGRIGDSLGGDVRG